MTKNEYETFIKSLHEKGWKDESIVAMFVKMFQDKKISRDELEALLDTLGYGLTENLKKLSDDELRKSL